ncbi:MAG: hypothetical protein FWC24_05900 [Treponema sp.]|nr:hypothetical protein [Treponema sp.]
MPLKAVMYGAGNIGRGFIGQIFAQSGYEICFIDINETVIDAINKDRRYPVRILRENGGEDIWIEGVRAVNGNDPDKAAQAIAEADIMASAVGVRVLPHIAHVMAAGLKRRFASGNKPLNIIICENLIDADGILKRLIKDRLGREEQAIFDEQVGLVKSSIGRMVPIQTDEMHDGNILRVCVEEYGFLPVDKAAFKGAPHLTGICPFDDFNFYIQRKLFIHNMGHAACAYLGTIKGDTCIYETTNNGSILFIAQNAMLESALALSAKYGRSLTDLHYHILDLLKRFSNKALADTCARVGADTARKLGNQDRLIGALLFCAGQGVNAAYISAGAAAALYCHLKEKGISQSREAAQAVLRDVSGLTGDSAEAEKVLLFYSIFASFPVTGDFNGVINKIIKTASDMTCTEAIV